MINTIQNPLSSSEEPKKDIPSDPTQSTEKVIKRFSKPVKRKSNKKYLIAGILLLFLVIGGGVSLYLTKINQDLRQQADTGAYSDGKCTQCLNGKCVAWDPTGPHPGDSSCEEKDIPKPTTDPGDDPGDDPKPTTKPGDPTPTTDPGNPTPTTDPGNPTPTTDPADPTPTTDPADPTPTSGGEEPTAVPTDSWGEEPTAVPTDSWNDDWDGGGSSSSYSESNSSATVNITNENSTTVADGTQQTGTQQPNLPEALPQSGPGDWIKYLQIGLGALGAGALLLLFL